MLEKTIILLIKKLKGFVNLKFQDQAEANWGGLRGVKKVLWESDGGEQKVAEGSSRA